MPRKGQKHATASGPLCMKDYVYHEFYPCQQVPAFPKCHPLFWVTRNQRLQWIKNSENQWKRSWIEERSHQEKATESIFKKALSPPSNVALSICLSAALRCSSARNSAAFCCQWKHSFSSNPNYKSLVLINKDDSSALALTTSTLAKCYEDLNIIRAQRRRRTQSM